MEGLVSVGIKVSKKSLQVFGGLQDQHLIVANDALLGGRLIHYLIEGRPASASLQPPGSTNT